MIRGWCIAVLLIGLFQIPALAQSPAPPAIQNQAIEEIRAQVRESEKEVARTTGALEEMKKDIAALAISQGQHNASIHENDKSILNIKNGQERLLWIGSILAFLITIGGVGALRYAYNQLKIWSQENLMKETKQGFTKDIATQFESERKGFDSKINTRFAELNNQISDLVVLIQRAERGQHDEAIEAIGWNGKLASLQQYPIEIQKLVIHSALQGAKVQPDFKDAAWTAAEQIYEVDRTASNLSFLYEIAASARAWDKGYDYHKRFGGDVATHLTPAGFLSLLRILRRKLAFDEALPIAKSYEGRMTSEIVQILGHLRTNMGDFDEADALLRPQMQELMSSGGRGLPADWFMVAYSFLLNCSEMGDPMKGLEVARFSKTMLGDSLLQYGVLRLALHLEALEKHEEASELIEGIRQNLERLPKDATTLQIQARLIARDGDVDEALKLLRESEPKVLSGEIGSIDLERGKYFVSCLIGEFLIRAGQFEEARQALHVLSLNDNVGEARFLIALSYAMERRDEDCARHIDHAGMIHRRWCKIAQLSELYPEIVASHQRIDRKPCASVSTSPSP